jgi:polyvinyl alcohol dehydrogenase (cytochrome)
MKAAYAHSTTPLLLVLSSAALFAAAPDGAALYATRCAVCHDAATPAGDLRVPKKDELSKRAPQNIVDSMTSGPMREQAKGLSEDDKRAIASHITGKAFDGGTAPVAIQGMCEGAPPPIQPGKFDWNGWGLDAENTRFQPNPGIEAEDVPKLKVKWAFGFPGAALSYSQPTVVAGRVFVGSAIGKLYALDAKSGCMYWTFDAGAWVRGAPLLAKLKDRWVIFIGDEKAQAHAVDAMTGKTVWTTKLDDHPVARIAGGLKLVNGKLYVPISSVEEVTGPNAKYECCKFRGALSSLDAATGAVLWKTHPITDPPKAFKTNSAGTQMFGPAGGAVWDSPTIDLKRKVAYFGTGNSYTDVETRGTEAIVAVDLETGSIKWMNQLNADDNFLVGCGTPGKGNCPEKPGPDYDFGTSPILRTVAGGKQLLLCGQKSGIIYALDPDKRGELVWKVQVGAGSALGGIQWGPAADKDRVYVAVSDIVAAKPKPGLTALRIADGKEVWHTPTPKPACSFKTSRCSAAQSAAVTAIPGVVFSGALDGHLRGYSSKDGSIVWDFDTGIPFETVNQVKANGGSIDGAGPVIVDGMLFTGSGYARFMGGAGNVLLAFSVDGK